MYLGKVKERLDLQVTLKNIFEYEKQGYAYWTTEYHKIHIFEDAEGNILKWDTTSRLCKETKVDLGDGDYELMTEVIPVGSVIRIKGTVKDHKEYKGTEQTVLTRVSLVSVIEMAETYEEREARLAKEREAKAQEQRASLKGDDFIWRMPYKQYKEHYSDFETIIDSFKCVNGFSSIEVIIRADKLKKSGVRFKRYNYFAIIVDGLESDCYKAISEDTALRRAKKAFPDASVEVNGNRIEVCTR